MSTEQAKCPECNAYHGHSYRCSLMSEQYARSELIRYGEAYNKQASADRNWTKKVEGNAERRVQKAWEQTTLWQGKCAILRHENNQLRKKLKAKQ